MSALAELAEKLGAAVLRAEFPGWQIGISDLGMWFADWTSADRRTWRRVVAPSVLELHCRLNEIQKEM